MKFLTIIFMMVAGTAYGGTSFEVIHFRPEPLPGSFLSVASVEALKPWHFSTNLHLDYGLRPLQITDRLGTKTTVIPQLLAGHLGMGVGLASWISASVDFPVVFERFQQVGGIQTSNQFGIGDIQIAARGILIGHEEGRRFGLAVQPFLRIPTGYDSIFLSHGFLSGGLKLISDISLTPSWRLSTNVAVHIKKEFETGDTHSHHDLTFSVGASYAASQKWKHFMEVHAKSPLDRFFQNRRSANLEARYGLSWNILPELKLVSSVGGNVLNDVGSPLVRFLTGVQWIFPSDQERPVEVPAETRPEPESLPTTMPTTVLKPRPVFRKRKFLPIR